MLWMEFGMRESSGRADSRRHATRAHEKLWLLPPVNREGQPTKNNITFYGQPNFVARWWASAKPAVCYRRPLSRSSETPLTTSAMPILAAVIDHRKTFDESRRGLVKWLKEFRNGCSTRARALWLVLYSYHFGPLHGATLNAETFMGWFVSFRDPDI